MPKHLCRKSHGITPVNIRKSRSQKKSARALLGQSYHALRQNITLWLVCGRGSQVDSSQTGLSLKLVIHKFRALVAQNTSDLGTIKGLNLLTCRNPVNEGKNFAGNDSCRLVLHWHKERDENTRLVMFDSECCCNKISFLVQAPFTPISRIKMDGMKTWCILSIVTDTTGPCSSRQTGQSGNLGRCPFLSCFSHSSADRVGLSSQVVCVLETQKA